MTLHGQDPGQPTTPTAPAASPASAPQLNPDVFNDKGQKWMDLYHGVTGSAAQLKADHATAVATAQQELTLAQDGVTKRDAEIAQLTAASTEKDAMVITLTEQAKQLPDLLRRDAYASRLEQFMLFPQLVSAQAATTIPGEGDAEPTTVMVNPYLQMLKDTTLTGDELSAYLAQLSATAVPQATSPTPPTMPAPATPAPASTPAERMAVLWTQMKAEPNNQVLRDEWMNLLAEQGKAPS